jgi:uncharacterized membrane protein
MLSRLRGLLVDGVLLALPLAAAAYLAHKVFGLAMRLLVPVAHLLPQGRWVGVAALEVVAVALLLLAVLLLGLFARSAVGHRLGRVLEDAVTSRLPGYQVIRSIATDLAGVESDDALRPVIVRFDDNTALGFLVEQPEGTEQATVFIPGAPGAASGNVVLVPMRQVQMLDASVADARRTMKLRGWGLQALAKAQSTGSK